MNKVLLVYEDYSELMSLEGLLKRVGFDVVGLTSEYAVAEQVLAFNPDLVVGSGRGGKVSSLGVGKRLKEMTRWQGKSVLIFPPNFKPAAQDLMRIRADMLLEAPVLNARVVQVIGRLLGEDEAVLLDRLAKLSTSESQHREQQASSMTGNSSKFSAAGEAIYVRGSHEDDNRNTTPENAGGHFGEVSTGDPNQRKMGFRFDLRETQEQKTALSGQEKVDPSSSEFSDVDFKALEKELLGGGSPQIEKIEEAAPLSSSQSLPENTTDVRGELNSPKDSKESLNSLSGVTDSENLSTAALEEELKNFALQNPLPGESSQTPDADTTSLGSVNIEELEKELIAFADQPTNDEKFSDGSLDEAQIEIEELQAKALKDLAKSAEQMRKKMAKYQALVADVKVPPKSEVRRVEARRRLKDMKKDWDQEKNNDNDKLRREFTTALFKK